LSKKIYNNTIADYKAIKLLTPQKLHRLASTDFLNAIKILTEYGYATADSTDIDVFMQAQYSNLSEFLDEYCDSKDLIEFLKAKLALISPSKDVNFELLKELYKQNLKTSKKLGKNYLLYSKLEIDLTNILTAYRACRLGLDIDSLKAELFEGGTITLDDFDCLVDKKLATLAKELNFPPLEESFNALLNNNLTAFRKASEELLYNTLSPEFTSYLKFGPLLHYCLNYISEYKTVNFILVALKNNIKIDLGSLWSAAE